MTQNTIFNDVNITSTPRREFWVNAYESSEGWKYGFRCATRDHADYRASVTINLFRVACIHVRTKPYA